MNITETVKNTEFTLADRNFNMAREAVGSNIIGRGHNHMVMNSPLTSGQTPSSQFFGRDIKPHFKGTLKQDILLDNGNRHQYYTNKVSNEPLFSPMKNTNENYGAQNNIESLHARQFSSQMRYNELPFEQIRVGSGVGKEFTAIPNGGFHKDYREHIMPKTIDQLRTKSNPKISYNGVTVIGKSINNKSKKIGKVEKRSPDTAFLQTPEQYLRTTATVKKEEARPAIYLKDTNRKDSVNYTPSANPIAKGDKHRSLYKKSTKNIYTTSGNRNLHDGDGWANLEVGDYGKNTIANPPNERTITGERTHLNNFSAITKAIIAPLLDVFRTTKKENFIGNIRETGNMSNNVPKNIVKDPNDIARTTIKEMNIENSHNGNMSNNVPKNIVKDPADIARTTIKEMNIENSHNGNMSNNVPKNIVKDPNDIARTTIKETSIDNSHTGTLTGPVKLATYDPNQYIVSTTNRQITGNTNYVGNMDSEGRGGGYMTNKKTAPTTNRQILSKEYGGGAMSFYKKMTSYDKDYNANINRSKEKTLVGRKPTLESVKLAVGLDKINMRTKKIMGDSINNRTPNKEKTYIKSYRDNSIYNKDKNRYDFKILDEQINPALLMPFNKNPYTHSLKSS